MKRESRTPPKLPVALHPPKLEYSVALRYMFKGSRLVRTNGKPSAFDVSPGGPIADTTARRILEHKLCKPADAGLLPDKPQSWEFQTGITCDT